MRTGTQTADACPGSHIWQSDRCLRRYPLPAEADSTFGPLNVRSWRSAPLSQVPMRRLAATASCAAPPSRLAAPVSSLPAAAPSAAVRRGSLRRYPAPASVSRSKRFTKLRVTPSASASSPADRYLLCSSSRFHRCARASARISVSSGRGFAGAQASLPSGAIITFRPPWRFQVIGMWTAIVVPSNSQFWPKALRFDFMLLPPPVANSKLLDQRLQPLGAQPHLHAIGRQDRPARPAAGRSAPARPGRAHPTAARSR